MTVRPPLDAQTSSQAKGGLFQSPLSSLLYLLALVLFISSAMMRQGNRLL